MILLSGVAIAQSAPGNTYLQFEVPGKMIKTSSLSELTDTLRVVRIQLDDPYYKKHKEYKAFMLADLLQFAFGENLSSGDYSEVVFKAADGYESVTGKSRLLEDGGYVVFEDTQFPDWETIDDKKVKPAPFYIVWTGNGQYDENGYPWTWQLSTVELVSFSDRYPEVYPAGADKNSPIFAGFNIFKENCVKCHSMNKEGGRVGPDLNAPRSIVSYRSEFMIKEMIVHPSRYRYTKMPDFDELNRFDLDNLLEYFNYMNKEKN